MNRKTLRTLKNIYKYIFLRFHELIKTDPSQHGESKLVERILLDVSKSSIHLHQTFLEIGSNSIFQLSNSWYLEKVLGFRGVSVDPISSLSSEYKFFRPNTEFINAAIIPQSDQNSCESISFYECNASTLSTIDPNEMKRYHQMGYSFVESHVPTTTFQNLIDQSLGFDIIFIDIESTSLQLNILNDILNSSHCPPLLCVETLDFSQRKNNILKYDKLLEGNYVRVAGTFLNSLYLRSDLLAL